MERVIIEGLFAQLKSDILILSNTVRVSIEKVSKLILSCTVLHSIAKKFNDNFKREKGFQDVYQELMYTDELGDDGNRLWRRGLQKLDDIATVLNGIGYI